jgi:hypothetical protein
MSGYFTLFRGIFQEGMPLAGKLPPRNETGGDADTGVPARLKSKKIS